MHVPIYVLEQWALGICKNLVCLSCFDLPGHIRVLQSGQHCWHLLIAVQKNTTQQQFWQHTMIHGCKPIPRAHYWIASNFLLRLLIFDLHSALTLQLYFNNTKLTKHERNKVSLRVEFKVYILHSILLAFLFHPTIHGRTCRVASD